MARCKWLMLVAVLLSGAPPSRAADPDPWADLRFLIGEWAGEGKGAPGAGKGTFSFGLELQDKVMVRKHRAEIPAAGGHPAATHEDLMVIHAADGGNGLRVAYFDSEGHVIHYTVTVAADKQTVTFVSDAAGKGPRFRLSYVKQKDDTLAIKFEIAPPGKPDEFKTYTEGTAARERRAK